MDLVLFGMQGSGKGTQSQRIAEHCGLEIFETGGELRRLSSQDNELARKVKSIMEAGHLVSTEVVMEIIENFMEQIPEGKGILFDGIPRSMDQKEQFDALMLKKGRSFVGLLIELKEEEALKRLSTRRLCSACKKIYPADYAASNCEDCGAPLMMRQDDTPDAIRIRLQTFQEKTVPVINSYKEASQMLTVNGEKSIDEVTLEIQSSLTPKFQWA